MLTPPAVADAPPVCTCVGAFSACEGSSRVKLGNVTVRNNRATRDGGGAYVGFDAKVTVSSSHVRGHRPAVLCDIVTSLHRGMVSCRDIASSLKATRAPAVAAA